MWGSVAGVPEILKIRGKTRHFSKHVLFYLVFLQVSYEIILKIGSMWGAGSLWLQNVLKIGSMWGSVAAWARSSGQVDPKGTPTRHMPAQSPT